MSESKNMATKAFERSEYDECDLRAKECIIGWLKKNTKPTSIEHQERRGADITVFEKGGIP